jgi:hypothetical protein
MKIATVLNVDLEKLLEDIENTVYLIGLTGGDNHGFNSSNIVVGSSSELGFEIQKLQLQLELKDKELAMKDREIAYLKELNELLKSKA